MLGLRRSELLSLRWEHIDLNARLLRVPKTKNKEPLVLPIPTYVVGVLEGLPSRERVNGFGPQSVALVTS
jgi:integrase